MTAAHTLVPPPEPLPAGNDLGVPDTDPAAQLATPDAGIHIEPDVKEKETDWCPQDIVEEWGLQSFPASDAPANW